MEKIIKYLPLATLMTVIGIGIGIAKFLVEEVKNRSTIEQRLHATPEERLKAEEHVKTFEEDKKMMIQWRAHYDEVTHEVLNATRDLNKQRKQDSIVRMNDAITNYQTKQQVDTIVKYWKKYNESVNN